MSIGTTLSTMATQLENWATAEWTKIKAEAVKIEQEVEPVIESGLSLLLQDFGQLAVQTVTNLMTAAGASLSGGEKLNLTATTIVQAAEAAGKTVAAEDVTALAKNAYIAVMGTAPAAGATLGQEAASVVNKAIGDVTQQ